MGQYESAHYSPGVLPSSPAIGTAATAASSEWPPRSLLAAVRKTVVGENNLDLTLNEFLLHVRTDQQQYYVQRLKEYEAMLHLVGLLAGIVGTSDEQTAAREKVMAAIEAYLDTIQVEEAPDSAIFTAPLGAPPGASGGMALSWLLADWFGWDDQKEMIEEAGRLNYEANQAALQMIGDFFRAIWDAMERWWNEFWETYETEGLLIAMNRLRIDLQFFIAECAIDVAISVALAGAGAAVAAALKGLRFVGKRVARGVTRVVVHAIPDGIPDSRIVKLTEFDIPDEKIAPEIDRIMDEDRFGGASSIDEVETNRTPNPDTPNTTTIHGHGRNTATIEVDPETGRPHSAEANIFDDAGGNPRNDNATEIGRMGNEGDHGGHIIAHRFMGDVPDEGIVPQAGNLNTGAWKRMENEWADWIAYGKSRGTLVEIDVKVRIIPPGAVRPDRFVGRYVVYETGLDGIKRIVRQQPIRFENKPGETFDRIRFRTDSNGRMEIIER